MIGLLSLSPKPWESQLMHPCWFHLYGVDNTCRTFAPVAAAVRREVSTSTVEHSLLTIAEKHPMRDQPINGI